MCQACYDKGYNDYPNFDSSVSHVEDYKRGYKTKQNEIPDPNELEHTFFCDKCYERGISNREHGVWSPPMSTKRGHYESYEKGYNHVDISKGQKIPEYYLPDSERQRKEKKPVINQRILLMTVIFILSAAFGGFVINRYFFAQSVPLNSPAPNRVDVQPQVVQTVSPSVQQNDSPNIQNHNIAAPAISQGGDKASVSITKQSGIDSATLKKEALPDNKMTQVADTGMRHHTTRKSWVVGLDDSKFPNTSEKVFTEQDLKIYSKAELKLMRNEIFARHGYIFKASELDEYFRKKPWYHAVHENVNPLLSPVERENVALIKKLEQ